MGLMAEEFRRRLRLRRRRQRIAAGFSQGFDVSIKILYMQVQRPAVGEDKSQPGVRESYPL
jgi:hypothetical protein